MTSGIDPDANAALIAAALEDAAKAGAQWLFAPEMALLLDSDRHRSAPHIVAETDNAQLRCLQKVAASTGCGMALGLPVHGADGRRRNRLVLISSSGDIIARYDKIHLFDVDLASGERWRESSVYTPGERAVVARLGDMRVGLSICYDLRFPALYQALSASGADILAIPAAFTEPTGRAHWHSLLRARAIENASFVIAAAQTGHHADGRTTYGHSLVVDPWGNVVLDMGQEAGIAIVDLARDKIAEARRQVPVLENRRLIPLVSPDPAGTA